MTVPSGLEQRLADVRKAFDEVFATAPITTVPTFEDLLAIRIAGDPYALRVREITGLVVSRKLVPLPSRRPELLGVVGNRGSLVVVYGLAAILGYGADSKATRWLALAGGAEPIGLAFGDFEGFVRVRSADLHAASATLGVRPHAMEVVLVDNLLRPVVDIASTLTTLGVPVGIATVPKES